jgi:hypothetical protein
MSLSRSSCLAVAKSICSSGRRERATALLKDHLLYKISRNGLFVWGFKARYGELGTSLLTK